MSLDKEIKSFTVASRAAISMYLNVVFAFDLEVLHDDVLALTSVVERLHNCSPTDGSWSREELVTHVSVLVINCVQ